MTQPLNRRIVTEQSLVDGTARSVLNGVAMPLVQEAWPHVMGAAALAEELSAGATLPATISATTTIPIGVALSGAHLTAATLVANSTVAESGTDYWAVSLHRIRSGSTSQIARKTTGPTTGEGFTPLKAWTFDAWPFANNDFAKDDVVAITFTKTGSPADITGAIIAYSLVPADVTLPVVLAVDDFNRADDATLGGVWTDLLGVWSVSANVARPTGQGIAYRETHASDVAITVKVTSSGTGPIFRCVDADNYWGVSSSSLFYRLGGEVTNVGSVTYANGDTIRVIAKGETITVQRDTGSTGTFTTVRTVTSATHASGTKHGIRALGAMGAGLGVDSFYAETA